MLSLGDGDIAAAPFAWHQIIATGHRRNLRSFTTEIEGSGQLAIIPDLQPVILLTPHPGLEGEARDYFKIGRSIYLDVQRIVISKYLRDLPFA